MKLFSLIGVVLGMYFDMCFWVWGVVILFILFFFVSSDLFFLFGYIGGLWVELLVYRDIKFGACFLLVFLVFIVNIVLNLFFEYYLNFM